MCSAEKLLASQPPETRFFSLLSLRAPLGYISPAKDKAQGERKQRVVVTNHETEEVLITEMKGKLTQRTAGHLGEPSNTKQSRNYTSFPIS